MASSEERTRILKMIQDGKITAEEGAQLLKSMDLESEPGQTSKETTHADPTPWKFTRWFHIRVTDGLSGKPEVNLRIPVNLIKVGLKIGSRFSPEVDKIDVEELTQFLNSNETGPFIDVNEENGDHVEIFVEE